MVAGDPLIGGRPRCRYAATFFVFRAFPRSGVVFNTATWRYIDSSPGLVAL
jgi:hypothetical protein